jgi:hypothetical protein
MVIALYHYLSREPGLRALRFIGVRYTASGTRQVAGRGWGRHVKVVYNKTVLKQAQGSVRIAQKYLTEQLCNTFLRK